MNNHVSKSVLCSLEIAILKSRELLRINNIQVLLISYTILSKSSISSKSLDLQEQLEKKLCLISVSRLLWKQQNSSLETLLMKHIFNKPQPRNKSRSFKVNSKRLNKIIRTNSNKLKQSYVKLILTMLNSKQKNNRHENKWFHWKMTNSKWKLN